MVKKVFDIQTKMALQTYFNIEKIDQQYFYHNCLANFIIAKSQNNIIKKPQIKKSKIKSLKIDTF